MISTLPLFTFQDVFPLQENEQFANVGGMPNGLRDCWRAKSHREAPGHYPKYCLKYQLVASLVCRHRKVERLQLHDRFRFPVADS
jgi:hypothetical protein